MQYKTQRQYSAVYMATYGIIKINTGTACLPASLQSCMHDEHSFSLDSSCLLRFLNVSCIRDTSLKREEKREELIDHSKDAPGPAPRQLQHYQPSALLAVAKYQIYGI
jgi:hypothetical protein